MLLREFVATRVRELRAQHGLTQEQVAAMLGTDVKWYQRVEWSEKDLRVSSIDRLAALFGVTVLDFLNPVMPVTTLPLNAPAAPHKPRRNLKRG